MLLCVRLLSALAVAVAVASHWDLEDEWPLDLVVGLASMAEVVVVVREEGCSPPSLLADLALLCLVIVAAFLLLGLGVLMGVNPVGFAAVVGGVAVVVVVAAAAAAAVALVAAASQHPPHHGQKQSSYK